ncbi:chromate transporter [Paenibacillus cellulosilyticus]|uniref:Chromate transporter n=1 Tax=Paenibacillus cellulosilyticus TaxID=375489 RepID=A0A2V2YPL7_9BACL|nr:chromate efflux transporter [Paenibacillus cellulosilyticus]PWV98440.1 chromate transporter [Paenibacillus cellulosilyticus]
MLPDVPVEITKGKTKSAILEIFRASLKLGLTSFGGPIAHLGYFHSEYIKRRGWLDERGYADLVALCQLLPGPASSQVGIGIGTMRAGLLGGIAAWIGFTLPSAIVLMLLALLLHGLPIDSYGWIHGLKIVAVAIVAQAIHSMGMKLASDRSRATVAAAAASVTLLWPTAGSQLLLIAGAAIVGYFVFRKDEAAEASALNMLTSRRTSTLSLILFVLLLALLPIIRAVTSNHYIALMDSFYRSGALVFGGGHVVLPLLEREVVPTGWISSGDFLAGYGAAQAVPGPLFTFASYLGAVDSGVVGAIVATIAIFLPAYLLVVGAMPFWQTLLHHARFRGAVAGINAAVVGILLAAFYDPIWVTAITGAREFALALVLFTMLTYWKLPIWSIIVAGAIGGMLIQPL